MEELDKAGLSTKEAASLSQEQRKLKDVVSKSLKPPGLFSSAKEVDKYMSEEMDEIERNARLNREIRYTKLSTSSMKRSSDVFRLKKDHITLAVERASLVRDIFIDFDLPPSFILENPLLYSFL